MSEILSKIDINDYGLQSMLSGGGGAEPEDLTLELAAQDTALSTQQTKIDELEAALDDKIALDLQAATADANAIPEDLVYGETAYVNGQKITGTASKVFSGDSAHATNISYDSHNGLIVALTRNNPPNLMLEKGAGLNIYPSDIATAINLQANQIKKDETILGVTGTYEGTKAVLPNGARLKLGGSNNVDWLNDVDTSNVTDMSGMFYGCSAIVNIPLIDTSSATNMNQMFQNCNKITSISLLNTSNVTDMSYAFNYCFALVSIPLFNTSKVKSMNSIFQSCPALSNESLNNILAMCTNSAVTSNKTLKNIGLSQTQAETCQTLSNWDAFVAAGWTSGY